MAIPVLRIDVACRLLESVNMPPYWGSALRGILGWALRAAMRRISSLEYAYGDERPKIDYRRLAERTSKVRVIQRTFRWVDTHRFSNRQKRKTPISGVVGTLAVEGELTEVIPLLRYTELLN